MEISQVLSTKSEFPILKMEVNEESHKAIGDGNIPCTSGHPSSRRPKRDYKRKNTDRHTDTRLGEKLMAIGGPSYDLPACEMTEKKFSNHSRLYIGNLSERVDENELRKIFSGYGEINDLYVNREKHFGFLKFDFKSNADRARRELDGKVIKGKPIKVRFSSFGSTIKVKNLTSFVTNELLYTAFSIFGEIDRCIVSVNERGRSLGEGIVEFTRKSSALMAVEKCTSSCFFLTSSLRPAIVELYDPPNESEGFSESHIYKKDEFFRKERKLGPRFAAPGSFEHEYGQRWLELHELYANKTATLKRELEMEQVKLEAQMEFVRFDQETEMIRQMLKSMEAERDRQKRELEVKERQAAVMRQREEDRRRQLDWSKNRDTEDSLFMKANYLSIILDEQEKAYDDKVWEDDVRSENGNFCFVGENWGENCCKRRRKSNSGLE